MNFRIFSTSEVRSHGRVSPGHRRRRHRTSRRFSVHLRSVRPLRCGASRVRLGLGTRPIVSRRLFLVAVIHCVPFFSDVRQHLGSVGFPVRPPPDPLRAVSSATSQKASRDLPSASSAVRVSRSHKATLRTHRSRRVLPDSLAVVVFFFFVNSPLRFVRPFVLRLVRDAIRLPDCLNPCARVKRRLCTNEHERYVFGNGIKPERTTRTIRIVGRSCLVPRGVVDAQFTHSSSEE